MVLDWVVSVAPLGIPDLVQHDDLTIFGGRMKQNMHELRQLRWDYKLVPPQL